MSNDMKFKGTIEYAFEVNKTTLKFYFENNDQLTQFIKAQNPKTWDTIAKTATVEIKTAEEANEANFNANMALEGKKVVDTQQKGAKHD